MSIVRILLVGIGGYGENYVRELVNKTGANYEVVGVVDPYPQKCQSISNIIEKNIPVFSTMEAFFKENSADLTFISTPIFLHTEHILIALSNNSNVLCEKPLCADENDISIIRKESDKRGKFVYVGFQWAYSEAVTKLKSDILSNKYGKMLEMKSLVLRPRNRTYFGRGVGWAGKIKTPDGKLILDSIANNSAAHYLFDMLFLMGDYGKAALPSEYCAELFRANDIENYDIAHISAKLDTGATVHFMAAHPVLTEVGPLYIYKFEKALIVYANKETEAAKKLLPEWYCDYGNIVTFTTGGEKIIYGNPLENNYGKMHIAINAVLSGKKGDSICGIDAAGAFTSLINKVQNTQIIHSVKVSLIKEKDDTVYVEGLLETMLDVFSNPKNSLLEFAD